MVKQSQEISERTTPRPHHDASRPNQTASGEAPPEITQRPRNSPPKAEDVFAVSDDMPSYHWSIPWADLMMTMFIMFAVLFVYASAKRDYLLAFRGHVEKENILEASNVGRHEGDVPVYEFPKTGIHPNPGPHELYEMCKAAVDESGLQAVHIEMDGETIRISMHGPLLFDRTQASLNPGGQRFLDMVAGIIAKARYNVHIHGHTDNFPVHTTRYDTNWELSTTRAVNVARYLTEQRRVAPEQVTVSGHSMFKPTAPNLSSEGKARNRRVEIELTRPDQKPLEQE